MRRCRRACPVRQLVASCHVHMTLLQMSRSATVFSIYPTMAASITIAHGHGRANLPVRVLHLMPFHIQHTGPAPVSTYFHIQPQVGQSSSLPGPSSPSREGKTVTTATVTTEVSSEEKDNHSIAAGADLMVEDPAITVAARVDVVVANATTPATPVLRSGPIRRLSEFAKGFVSSFRGRTVHGVEVALPKGYGGIVLRGDANDKAHTYSSTASKANCRSIRRPRRQPAREDELDEVSPEDVDGHPARVLKPTARFDSFVLWHPVIPVDEGKDEYLRSLTEWTSIASEVRACFPANVKRVPHST